MALGTPVAGTVAYSASGGTSVSPAYPAGITANTAILLIVGQKPSTANGGTVTTPTGWTLRDELTGAGGYGTALAADTGNTNLRIYSKNVVSGTETGNLAVTLGANGVSWAFMVRIPTGGGALEYGSADGSRTTAPTAGTPFAVALTNGAAATNFQAGDKAIWAMCIPSDVTTPSQFSAQSVTATGATFDAAVEFNEPDSATGNDIGGYSAYAHVASGSSTTAPSVTVTAAGTVTNVRGPVVLVRVREIAGAAQNLTPSLYTNTNQFFSPAVSQVAPAQNLTPARYTNASSFFTAAITQASPAQTLAPALYTNTNTFFSATVSATRNLAPNRYDNTNTFYAASLTKLNTLTPARYNNTNVFYTPQVTATGADQSLLPARYNNTNVFYSATVGRGTISLATPFYQNTQTFYSADIEQMAYHINPPRVDNTNAFYQASISQADFIRPNLFTNTNAFYSASVVSLTRLRPLRTDNQNAFYGPSISVGPASIQFLDYSQSGYVDTGYTTLGVLNNSVFFLPSSRNVNRALPPFIADADTFYPATAVKAAYNLSPSRANNQNAFFAATASIEQFLTPARVNNQNAFYAAHVAIEQFLTAPLVTNTNTIYAVNARSNYTLAPIRIASTNVFYTPSVAVGPAFIVPSLFSNQNRFYKQSVLWWDNQPIAPETWDGIADTPASWDALPITGETWTELYDTETTWDSV